MDGFEEFTRNKIASLRGEIEALEKTLKEYQSAMARQSGQARRSGGDQPRSGAFGVVMDAINAAGHVGLTLDEMIEAAAAEGYTVKRPTLRSQVFQAKQDGNLVQLEPGRYRASHHLSPEEAFGGANTSVFTPPAEDVIPGFSGRLTSEGPRDVRNSFAADLDDEIPF